MNWWQKLKKDYRKWALGITETENGYRVIEGPGYGHIEITDREKYQKYIQSQINGMTFPRAKK